MIYKVSNQFFKFKYGKRFLSNFKPRPFINHSNVPDHHAHLFSDEFLRLVRSLSGEFSPRYFQLLEARKTQSRDLNYRKDTEWIRNDPKWKGPELAPELAKRWVEITGPAGDRKMMINALNSGANIYMADLEDSQSPEWFSMVQAYQNIYDACHGKLTYQKKGLFGEKAIDYHVHKNPAHMCIRPRGLHLFESHVIDEAGRHIPAGLFDICMYMFHNGAKLIKDGKRPLLYQPKLESFEESVLIHDIIREIEKRLDIPYGSTRVTALIETLPAILQAEEIGFGLGPYWAGLNCGRWDYIFSVLKVNSDDTNGVLPDRKTLNMKVPFLTNYMKKIVQVCHSRGVSALGGMSALIPSKDSGESEAIMKKVVEDKEYELSNGCDGAWVAHPGMVKYVHKIFENGLKDKPNQIESWKKNNKIDFSPEDFYSLSSEFKTQKDYTEDGLRTNISVGIQYIASWLSGQGAASINGLMEDMATAEISRIQVWQWRKHNQSFLRHDGSVRNLDDEILNEILKEEVETLKISIEKSTNLSISKSERLNKLNQASKIFHDLVFSPHLIDFLQDISYQTLNNHVMIPAPLKASFKAYKFSEEEKDSLRGTHSDITLDAKLSILRGKNFNKVMSTPRKDGLVPHGNFIGTPNGHSARNVIEGGLGYSWPYIGGWELNARGLALNQPMPDTLSVSFHEQGDLAVTINNFLQVADRVQELEIREKLNKASVSMSEEDLKSFKHKLRQDKIDYLTQPLLADLEQGWGDPKKIFLSVIRCLQNGVNIMHIEDQYSLKRCGHLGGKGLDDINSCKVIFKSANLAANLFKGVKLDGPNQNINFVARTDALSAEFIQYSNLMHNPSHPDHPFIDWDRKFTPDGRYLYLKKGVNPKTGIKYGIEHSAVRCAEIVKEGLASHVWMETPGADTNEARVFMELVNTHLQPHGLFARGLYNHSPSFVWDVSFFLEAQGIASDLAKYIQTEIYTPLMEGEIQFGRAQWMVQEYLKTKGDRSRGDYDFEPDYLSQLLANGIDLAKGEVEWKESLKTQMANLEALPPSLHRYKAYKELNRILKNGFRPLRHITNIIGAQRLKNFKNKLSDAGFEVHLCTLPLYPSDAHTASELARGMAEVGIHDFVVKQRAARKYEDNTGRLTSYFHQKATGTGWEVQINKIVGTGNTSILEGSTEVADQEKEMLLKKNNTGPSTYNP